MSAGQLERRKSLSSGGSRSASAALMPSPPLDINGDLEPCAATASLLLVAQGSSILALHHDSLTLDRKFESHTENILFIAVDNVSESGAGRLVVSYDTSQTAIIWDLFTGQEIARFASFELLRVASWMRNGNIAFGGVKGDIILFEPSTSEHLSARTIFDPITAIAPSADCRSHAIGYQNGSILIATIQPFTILHTLTTSRGPSPIVSLAWHASSTKQKSDMLATLTVDGDLLVWSVCKQPVQDPPRVIRTLRKPESTTMSPKWLAWSKNGRIVQYSDNETWAWDVRTKHVTYERIPTIQGIRGIANYGPTGSLFTLGPNHTVQQYDLIQPMMVANVQHVPSGQKSSPPEGLNSSLPLQAALASSSASQANRTVEELKQSTSSPPLRQTPPLVQEANRLDRNALRSPDSLRSRHPYGRGPRSLYSGTATTFSTSSPVQSTAESMYSLRYGSIASTTSAGSLRGGGSRLRHEYVPSSDEPLAELFPHTRSRLNEIPFRPPQPFNEADSNADDLRRQMLDVVFGWEGDILDLLNDELRSHSPGGEHAVILGRWLGYTDTDALLGMAMSAPSRYSGWMLLALSAITADNEHKKVGHAFVQKLLGRGDIHAAVALLIGLGDGNDGIEVYVARNMYMEAILLTCLLMPNEWTRQSYLVRRWGEFVVQNSQQHLAIRCFSCTENESPEVWASPTVQMTNILSSQLSSKASTSPSVVIQPPAPTNPSPSSSRPTAKNQALKLITSFSSDGPSFKFPGLQSADRTPTNVPGVTPIDSAMGDSILSPGGFATYKQKSRSGLSALTPGGHRNRLPSIGETPTDVNPPTLSIPKSLPTPDNSGSEKEKDGIPAPNQAGQEQLVFLTSARYTPKNEFFGTEQKSDVSNDGAIPTPRPTSKLEGDFLVSNQNGPRDRKPEGLHINWPPVYSPIGAPPSSDGSLRSLASSLQRRDRNLAFSPTSASESAKSLPSATSVRHVSEYVNGDSPSYFSLKPQNGGHDHGSKGHRKKESRGRSKQRYVQSAKRSPSSPVPMSPDDLAFYGEESSSKGKEPRRRRSRSESSRPPASRTRDSDRERNKSRNGRSRRRDNNFGLKSPSSPVSMLPVEATADSSIRLVSANRQQRLQSRDRSSGRRTERGSSSRRDLSPDRRRVGSRSRSQQPPDEALRSAPVPTTHAPEPVDMSAPGHMPDGTPIFTETIEWNGPAERQKEAERIRKEQAAAELEARRLSLVRRPSAPAVPMPGELPTPSSIASGKSRQSVGSPPMTNGSFSQRAAAWSGGSPANSTYSDMSRGTPVPVGLPATPRAMKHPKYSVGYGDIPPVPDLPMDSISPVNIIDGGRAMSISRSMSAPIPEDYPDPTTDGMPAHPHFRPRLPSSRGARVSMHRKEASHDATLLSPTQYGSISVQSIRKPSNAMDVSPILPELQHLSNPPPPPPPPPPSHFMETSDQRISQSSDRNSFVSGVGTINIAIDEPAVFSSSEVPPQRSQSALPASEYVSIVPGRSSSAQGPMIESQQSHRRGRSINDNLANKFRSLTGRMRSTSRGRNVRTPPSGDDVSVPYESVPMASVMEKGFDAMNKNEF